MLDLGLFSACICTVADHTTTCLPISVDFDFWCICSHYNMQRFFDFKGNPFYTQPVNFNFDYLDHLSLVFFYRRQQKVTLSSYILHFDSMNASHLTAPLT